MKKQSNIELTTLVYISLHILIWRDDVVQYSLVQNYWRITNFTSSRALSILKIESIE